MDLCDEAGLIQCVTVVSLKNFETVSRSPNASVEDVHGCQLSVVNTALKEQ